MGCECESLNGLPQTESDWLMMMTGPPLAWMQNWQSNIIYLKFEIYSLKLQHSHLFSDYCSNVNFIATYQFVLEWDRISKVVFAETYGFLGYLNQFRVEKRTKHNTQSDQMKDSFVNSIDTIASVGNVLLLHGIWFSVVSLCWIFIRSSLTITDMMSIWLCSG